MPKTITNIVVHCSASLWGCTREIRKWHTDPKPKGNGWSDIGYHFVILNGYVGPHFFIPSLDGCIEAARYLDEDVYIEVDEIGIHTLGYNETSVGICLIGIKGSRQFPTDPQSSSLKSLLLDLCKQYKIEPKNIKGHYETESGRLQGKTCPDFDMEPYRMWLKGRV